MQKRRVIDDDDISSLPVKKRGRPHLLGDCQDTIAQKYFKEGGGVVTA